MVDYRFIKITDDIESVKSLFPEISDEKFNELIKLDPTYKDGVNSVGTYGKWILNLYKKNNLKEEDFYKVSDYLTEFERKKKLVENKDINSYKTLPDLAKVLDETEEPVQSENQRKKAISRADISQDADFIGDFGDLVCYSPKTYEASCKLGKNTHWCTATNTSDGYYNRYTSQGPLFIFINKGNGQAEYQFHFPTKSFMDKNDDEIDLGEFLEKYPKVQEFVTNQITNTISKWSAADIIDYLGPIAIKYIDVIKQAYNSVDSYGKNRLMRKIIKNQYIENEFQKELKELLKEPSNANVIYNYLFNKEKREEYKEVFARWFGIEQGKALIYNDWLAKKLYEYGNTGKLDLDFIEACCYEVVDEYFYVDEFDVDANEGENLVSEVNKEDLKKLKLVYHNLPYFSRQQALIAGSRSGFEMEVLKDFNNALQEAFNEATFNGIHLKDFMGPFKKYDDSQYVIENCTIDNYFKLLDALKQYISLDDSEFDEECGLFADELPTYILAKSFSFNEPYYGWNEFDEDEFNYQISDVILQIHLREEEPEFDSEEELKQWHKWFDNNYNVGLKKDSNYIFLSDKDLNYVYNKNFVYRDKSGKLRRVSKQEIENYYNRLNGKYPAKEIYWMIKRADEDCDRYIDLHKDDIVELRKESKHGYKEMSKQEYINYLINAGYSDVDAEEKAEVYYDSIKDEEPNKFIDGNNMTIKELKELYPNVKETDWQCSRVYPDGKKWPDWKYNENDIVVKYKEIINKDIANTLFNKGNIKQTKGLFVYWKKSND